MKISFAHNVQNRVMTLRETITMEQQFFSNAKINVAYNDKSFNKSFFQDKKNINFRYYLGEGHKIGCTNGCIMSIQNSLLDDTDIIIFTHDDVSINPMYIHKVKENVTKILNNEVDVICRKPHNYGNNYVMMEGFFMNRKAAELIFSNLSLLRNDAELPLDGRGSPSPEVWLFNVLNNSNVRLEVKEYEHSNNNYNKVLAEGLGFYHKNAGIRGWKD
jgi:hypothetical protein